MTLSAALAGTLALGCGDDNGDNGEDCEDPNRNVSDLGFGEACCGDAECTMGTCAEFNNRGTLCTQPCQTDADCQGLGKNQCGGQGVCAPGE